MLRPLLAVTLGLVVIASGSAWWKRVGRGDDPQPQVVTSQAVTTLRPGIPVCLTISGGRTEFVLPKDSDGRFLLILGSVGNPHQQYQVEIQADPTDVMTRIDGIELPSWKPVESLDQPQTLQDATRSTAIRDPLCSSADALRSVFHLHVTDGPLDDARDYAGIQANEIARGPRIRVLLDVAEPQTPRLLIRAREIVRLYEERVLPRTQQLLGSHVDTDSDGRLTVVLTPWLGRLQGGKTSLGGLVRTADFRRDLPAPFSNRCDLMFLKSSVTSGPRLHALLAHEYAHVVTFSRRAERSAGVEDDWLSEGIAHVSEHLHGSGWTNLDHRIARFLESPQSHPLVIANYYQSGLWRDPGCRGGTFLFLRWCVDQFGESFLRQLVDGDAVGVRNVEKISGHTFDVLFRRWCIAVSFAKTTDRGYPLAYRSLSLNGRLGRHRLTGPKVTVWRRDERRATIPIRGTAAAYVEILGDSESARRFRIRASEGARLQATLIRIQ